MWVGRTTNYVLYDFPFQQFANKIIQQEKKKAFFKIKNIIWISLEYFDRYILKGKLNRKKISL